MLGRDPDPRRLRLRRRLPGRAPVARRARDADLRRRERHPAPGHRTRSGGGMKRAAALLLLVFACVARAAPFEAPTQPYYLQPWPERVAAYLERVDQEDAANVGKS